MVLVVMFFCDYVVVLLVYAYVSHVDGCSPLFSFALVVYIFRSSFLWFLGFIYMSS